MKKLHKQKNIDSKIKSQSNSRRTPIVWQALISVGLLTAPTYFVANASTTALSTVHTAYKSQFLKENHPNRHIVTEGEVFYSIASRFLVDPTKWLILWRNGGNNSSNPSKLYPGDLLELTMNENNQPGLKLISKNKKDIYFNDAHDFKKELMASIKNSSSNNINQSKSFFSDKYLPKVELSIKGGKERSIVRPGIIIPLVQTANSLVHLDIISMADTNKQFEGNFGIGYRQINNDNLFGIFAHYDIRRTRNANLLHQVTIGTEWFRDYFEFRANVYIPNTKKMKVSDGVSRITTTVGHLTEVTSFANTSFEQALRGFDVEVGGSLPSFDKLSAHVAYYNFGFDKKVKTRHGVRLRSEIKFNNWFALNGEISYDKKRKLHYFGGVRLSWNIGKSTVSNLTRLEQKMNQFPVRDIDIISHEQVQSEKLSTVTYDRNEFLEIPYHLLKDRVALNDYLTAATTPFANHILKGIILHGEINRSIDFETDTPTNSPPIAGNATPGDISTVMNALAHNNMNPYCQKVFDDSMDKMPNDFRSEMIRSMGPQGMTLAVFNNLMGFIQRNGNDGNIFNINFNQNGQQNNNRNVQRNTNNRANTNRPPQNAQERALQSVRRNAGGGNMSLEEVHQQVRLVVAGGTMIQEMNAVLTQGQNSSDVLRVLRQQREARRLARAGGVVVAPNNAQRPARPEQRHPQGGGGIVVDPNAPPAPLMPIDF